MKLQILPMSSPLSLAQKALFGWALLLFVSCSNLPQKAEKTEVRLDKGFYVIHYSPEYQLPHYVEYRLKAETLRRPKIKRQNRFHLDSGLASKMLPALRPDALKYSSYDRGHLAPSADFQWSEMANDSTFSMANMVPQSQGLNRGAWKALEEKVRRWACAELEVRVVTGPVLHSELSKTDKGVFIPEQFFKLIVDETPPKKAIGFILWQSDSKADAYLNRVVTVDEVEALAREDFFSDLPDKLESEIEGYSDISQWQEQDCSI